MLEGRKETKREGTAEREREGIQAEARERWGGGVGREEQAGDGRPPQVRATSQLQRGACQPGSKALAPVLGPARGGGSWARHLAVSAEPRPLCLT